MTKEEKELLLKDLGGRLPYGTFYDIKINGVTYEKVSLNSFYYGLIEKNFNSWKLQSIIPYLKKNTSFEHEGVYLENIKYVIDYYNSNHIDYRGLIEKGLANEAPEWMYRKE